MTIQERIDHDLIYSRFKDGTWREGTVEELEADFPFLKGYIRNINWYQNNTRVAILKATDREKQYHLYMFSNEHVYSIWVNEKSIGAGLSCRYREPLEDWTRGRDLPDGPSTEETFKKILFAILACELVSYDDGRKPPMKDECGENEQSQS